MTEGAGVDLRVGVVSDVGRARTANEDSYLRDDDRRLFVVADGMGGHRAGDVASATAVDTVASHQPGGDRDPLVELIEAANEAVWRQAQENPELRGMGTTVTAVVVDGARAHFGHVGDSRAYLLREGDLVQVTVDHSLVEQLVREGRITPEEAVAHPQRSVITRALGVESHVEVDTYDVDLRDGDRLLLCSDGLTSMVDDDEIRRVLRVRPDPDAAATELVEAANDAGGDDNITVLVIDVDAPGLDRAEAASAAVLGDTGGEATGEWSEPPVAPAGERGGDAPAPSDRTGAGPGSRRLLRRLLVWGLPVLIVVLVAALVLAWYARRSTWFVGLDGDDVALYRGVPGGFMVWDPTVEEVADLEAGDLSPSDRAKVRGGHTFSNRNDAEAFIDRLEREVEEEEARRATASTTTTSGGSSATTSTAPPGARSP